MPPYHTSLVPWWVYASLPYYTLYHPGYTPVYLPYPVVYLVPHSVSAVSRSEALGSTSQIV